MGKNSAWVSEETLDFEDLDAVLRLNHYGDL